MPYFQTSMTDESIISFIEWEKFLPLMLVARSDGTGALKILEAFLKSGCSHASHVVDL